MSLWAGLQGYWKLNEASWAGAADEVIDRTGNEYHGTAENGASTIAGGKLGRCGDFTPGSSHRCDCGDVCDQSGAFTVALWIYIDANTGNYDGIVTKMNVGSPNGGYGVYLTGAGQIALRVHDTTNYLLTETDSAASTGSWIHIIAVYDGGSTSSAVTVYIDNTAVSQTKSKVGSFASVTGSSQSVVFGCDGSKDANRHYDGRIDEVCIWDRALTASERASLYNSGSGYVIPVTSDAQILRGRIRGIVTSNAQILRGRIRGIITSNAQILRGRITQRVTSDAQILRGRITQRVTSDAQILRGHITQRVTSDAQILRGTIETAEGYNILVQYQNGEATDMEQFAETLPITVSGVTYPAVIQLSVFAQGAVYENRSMMYSKKIELDGAGAEVTQKPNTPSNLSGRPISGGAFKLYWVYNSANQQVEPSTYEIEANTGGGFSQIGTTPHPTRTFETGTYADGSSVSFRVRAVSGASANSAYSSSVSLTSDALASGDVPLLQVIRV